MVSCPTGPLFRPADPHTPIDSSLLLSLSFSVFIPVTRTRIYIHSRVLLLLLIYYIYNTVAVARGPHDQIEFGRIHGGQFVFEKKRVGENDIGASEGAYLLLMLFRDEYIVAVAPHCLRYSYMTAGALLTILAADA